MAISSVPVWHIATMKMIKINLKSSSSFAVIECDRFQLAFSTNKNIYAFGRPRFQWHPRLFNLTTQLNELDALDLKDAAELASICNHPSMSIAVKSNTA
jgi:hypothetical protein